MTNYRKLKLFFTFQETFEIPFSVSLNRHTNYNFLFRLVSTVALKITLYLRCWNGNLKSSFQRVDSSYRTAFSPPIHFFLLFIPVFF